MQFRRVTLGSANYRHEIGRLETSLIRSAIVSIALFALTIYIAKSARAECECLSNSVAQAIRYADTIFLGEVVAAAIDEDDSKTIEFVVKVGDAIRGKTDDYYNLSTSLPDSCGVSVLLGFHDIYVLGSDETIVSSCTGSGRVASRKYPLMAAAIALVDLPISDVSGALQLLSQKIHSGYPRAMVEEFFELVEKIDPSGNTVTRKADRIEFRGIVVHFKDGEYERVGVL